MTSVTADTRIASEQQSTASGRPAHALLPLRRIWQGPDGTLLSRRVFLNPFNVPGSTPVEIGMKVEGAPPSLIRPIYRRVWTPGGFVMSRWMFGSGQPVGVTRIEALGAPANAANNSALPFEFGEEQQGAPIPVEWGANRQSKAATPAEWLVATRREVEEETELLSRQCRDVAIPAEEAPGIGVSLDMAIPAEVMAERRYSYNTQVESASLIHADPGYMHAESGARPIADLHLSEESALRLLLDCSLSGEAGLHAQFALGATLAASAAALAHSVIETENLGAAGAVADRPLAVENAAALSRKTSGLVEWSLALVARFDLAKELQLAQRSDRAAVIEAELLARAAELTIEHLGSAAESRLSVEFAAQFLAGDRLPGEWAARLDSDVPVSIYEWIAAAHAAPAQSVTESGPPAIEWRAPSPAPLLQLGEGRRLATPGRIRLLKGPSGMRLPTAFDPINSDETDNFVFDFTGDVGAATMVSTRWTCALSPYQTATDPAPYLRVLSTSLQTKIQLRDPLTGALTTRSGNFSVASIGGMPASSIGSTYVLTAFVTLSDGRTLSLSSTAQCTAP